RQASFVVRPNNEPLDPVHVRFVTLDELAECGKTEIVRVAYPLQQLKAETIAPSVKKLMGPFGRTVPAEDGRLILMDAAANLRSVIQTIQEQEAREDNGPVSWSHQCKYILATTLVEHLKDAIYGPDRAMKPIARPVSIAADERANTIFVSG